MRLLLGIIKIYRCLECISYKLWFCLWFYAGGDSLAIPSNYTKKVSRFSKAGRSHSIYSPRAALGISPLFSVLSFFVVFLSKLPRDSIEQKWMCYIALFFLQYHIGSLCHCGISHPVVWNVVADVQYQFDILISVTMSHDMYMVVL